jgi:hypothetical protein
VTGVQTCALPIWRPPHFSLNSQPQRIIDGINRRSRGRARALLGWSHQQSQRFNHGTESKVVMAGLSRPKGGVAPLAYVPGRMSDDVRAICE